MIVQELIPRKLKLWRLYNNLNYSLFPLNSGISKPIQMPDRLAPMSAETVNDLYY